MTCGIYCIENMIDGKKYIGCSQDIEWRKKEHMQSLRRGDHKNRYLQAAYRLYGEEYFDFYILEVLESNKEILCNMEIYWIVYYNSYVKDGCGYNLTRGGEGCWGVIHSTEARKKNSDSHMGNKNFNFGKPKSEETRKKISEAQKGKTISLETRAKLSEINTGKTYSQETRLKHSVNTAGENNPFYGRQHSKESKEKMSQWHKGKILSETHKESISKSLKGIGCISEDKVNIIIGLLETDLTKKQISDLAAVSIPIVYKVKNGYYHNIYKLQTGGNINEPGI